MIVLEKFQKSATQTQPLVFQDGDYFAAAAFVGGAWSYFVFHAGEAVAGERSWNMDAMQACRWALDAIDRHKRGLTPEAHR